MSGFHRHDELAVPGPLHDHPLVDDYVSAGATRDLKVGDRTLHAFSDGFLLMTPDFIGNPDSPTAGYDMLAAQYGQVRLPLGCFLLRGERNVLIDTGYGPVDNRGGGFMIGGRLLTHLARLGLQPADIDIVALTHLHGDHTGTLGYLNSGEPVFPNARTIIGAADWQPSVVARTAPLPRPGHTLAALFELNARGLVEFLDDDQEIAPGVIRLAAPGHTPGHSIYVVQDHGERAIVLGDAMYCPQQLDDIELVRVGDIDPVLARRTRERLLIDLARHGGMAIGCHFPELKAARVLTGS